MPFVAQCTFCRVMLQGVPDHYAGTSYQCPRCRNSFTLAPMTDPPPLPARDPKAAATRAEPVIARPPQAAPAGAVQVAPAPAKPAPPPEDIPARRPVPADPEPLPAAGRPNYAGLASFLLGSFAFLAAAVLHLGLVTFLLALVGLGLGVVGCLRATANPRRLVLAVAGTAVSLPAVLVAAFLPHWLGLGPLWGSPKPPSRGGDALVSLNGGGGLRRVRDGEIVWVDASHDALLHGDVRLRVSSATVGPAPFEPVLGKQPPNARCLVIGLRITNAGLARKLDYLSWGGNTRPQDRPVLRDSLGRTYAEKAFPGGWTIKGRAASASIPPGKTLDDVLVFEAPPANVQYLRLELPAAAVGAGGQLRMEIPSKMITFR